jgi:hypothetical protein
MEKSLSETLSSEKLQMFLAGLSGLAPAEVRKAKLLYVRNAISEFEALKTQVEGFQVAQGCFAIVPVFWPILMAQKSSMQAEIKLSKERIRNAIEVWRDDLKGERFVLDGEEFRL